MSRQHRTTTKQKRDMTRKQMQSIADNISDIYAGRKIIVLMPGDKLPKELRASKP